MRDQLLATAGDAVEAARKAGADDAAAAASRSRSVSFRLRDGELEKVEDSTARALQLRLFVAGRYSAHSTTDLRPERLTAFVDEIVAMTRSLEKDPHRRLADPSLYPTQLPALELSDRAIGDLDRDARIAACKAMNERVAGVDKVVSATSQFGDTTAIVAAATSNGFQHAYEATAVGLYTSVTLDDGDRRPEDGMGAWGRHLDELPDAAGIADEALRLARARLGMAKGPTRRTTMVVDPRAAGSLIGRLLGPATGGALQQERSFWRGKLGTKLVSSRLTVVDDPLLARGLGSRPFDGEGIAAAKLPVIEAGTLKNLYLDTYYASKLSMAATTGSPSNRVVTLGKRGLAAILRDVDAKAIYVTSWLGGNMDSTTGDFSLGARGHLIEKGVAGAPIGEMNVTGNIVELFSGLAEVGNDPWRYSSTLAPTLVFDGVQFSGA
jgi:PmbA protein